MRSYQNAVVKHSLSIVAMLLPDTCSTTHRTTLSSRSSIGTAPGDASTKRLYLGAGGGRTCGCEGSLTSLIVSLGVLVPDRPVRAYENDFQNYLLCVLRHVFAAVAGVFVCFRGAGLLNEAGHLFFPYFAVGSFCCLF